MKRNYFIHLISLFLVVFSSCQKADDSITIENDKLPMSVIARIGDVEPASARYAGTLPNDVFFTEGDAIGIFMFEKNADNKGDVAKWTHDAMKWGTTADVNWPDRETEYTFKAFYPYDDKAEYTYTNIPMPSLLGQNGTFESVANRDFLIASTTQTYGTDGNVVLTFCHKLALIHMTINGSYDLTNATLMGITIKGGNIVAPSTYSFDDDKITINSNAEITDELSFKTEQATNNNLEYFFVLNNKNTNTDIVSLTITYKVNDTNYTATYDNFSGNVFTSGAQHDFTISVINNQISITGATINPWASDNNTEDNNIIINDPKEIENEEEDV